MSLYYCNECQKVTNQQFCPKCGNQTEYVIGIDLASKENNDPNISCGTSNACSSYLELNGKCQETDKYCDGCASEYGNVHC